MIAADFAFELRCGPTTPDENRDEYGRPIVVEWVWRVRRVDAFGEWVRDLDVTTNATGVVEEIHDEEGKIWPQRSGVDSLGPDRALHDGLRVAIDRAIAATVLELTTSEGRES